MLRTILTLACALCCFSLLHQASGQQLDKAQPVKLRILLPEEDATLTIDDRPTKLTGVKREFVSAPLEPVGTYAYILTATWEPNNYTKVIRTRKVLVRAGQTVEVDLRKAEKVEEDRFIIRFVPTPQNVVDAMCKLAEVGKDDVVYDLGSGDGRISITAVTKFKAKRGVGVDIDPNLVKLAQENAEKEGVKDRVQFRQGDVLDLKDLGDATVVMLYMGEDVNLRVRPLLKKVLRPGARIVSLDFSMGDWKADRKIDIEDDQGEEHQLYLWKIKK